MSKTNQDKDAVNRDRITSAPSRLIAIHSAFRNTTASLERWVELLRADATIESIPNRRGRRRKPGDAKGHRIRVQLYRKTVPKSFSGDPGKRRKAAIMRLPIGGVIGDGEDLETQCLRLLAGLRTDCLLTLYAAIGIAIENNGFVTDDIPTLARRRGWNLSSLDSRSRDGAPTRRERLQEHLILLSEIEFVLLDSSRREQRYVAFPMLRPYVEGGVDKGGRLERGFEVYEFHPLLWREMTHAGKAFFYDQSILTANPRKDEWAIRLLWYMSSRWGPCWVSKELDKHGGRLTERLGVLLHGADIEYENQLLQQGKPWVRRVFAKALDKLVDWKPEGLIGGYSVKPHPENPLEDRITFWPTDVVANRYGEVRSKAIAARDRKIQRRRKPREAS